MAIYALATLPLIERARRTDANQIWFADDSCAEGKLNVLLNWWKVLCTSGPLYRYCVNAPKSWLVVQERFYDEALRLFQGTGVHVTKEGRPLLGAPLGSPAFVKEEKGKSGFMERAGRFTVGNRPDPPSGRVHRLQPRYFQPMDISVPCPA